MDDDKMSEGSQTSVELKYSYLYDLFKEVKNPVKIIPQVVPWRTPEQFRKVYQSLYSTDISDKRWAVEQIDVWESRCYPSLPAAIDSSHTITRAIIQDIIYCNQINICREKEIRMLYAMAIIRFVNLTLESKRSYKRQPIDHVASMMGIPSWMVDLRNESAHSALPSLPVLRMGAEDAMIFLEESYWRKKAENLQPLINVPVDRDRIRVLLLAYLSLRLNLMSYPEIEKGSDEHNSECDVMNFILKKCSFCMRKYRKDFIEIMCTKKIFITSIKDYEMIFEVKERQEVKNEFGAQTAELSKIPKLPLAVENFWQPVLHIIAKYDGIPDLLVSLLETQGDITPESQTLLASWVGKILEFPEICCFGPETLISPLVRSFLKYTPLFDWNRLFFAAVANPCKCTPLLLSLITDHVKIDKEVMSKIMCLVSIKIGQCNLEIKEEYRDHPPFTLDDLKKAKRMQERKMNKGKKTENKWSYAPDNIDWGKIPIGHVFTAAEILPEKDESSTDDAVSLKNYISSNDSSSNNDFMDIDVIDNTEYPYKYLSNSSVMEEVVTVKKDIVEEDQRVISARKSFLYKRKYIS